MSEEKKRTREKFRETVFKRDGGKCRFCETATFLDAHHITDHTLMPNGGYVADNGITLCPMHHEMAEAFHRGDVPPPGFMPGDLYEAIGSSYQQALAASKRLK